MQHAAVSFLSAVLGDSTGAAILWSPEEEGGPHLGTTREEILRHIDNGCSSTELLTGDGELLGLSLVFATVAEAKAAIDRYGPPSLVLSNGEMAVLAYLFDRAIAETDPVYDAARAVLRTAAGATTQSIPLPGVNGWDYGRDADEADVAAGALPTFTLDQLQAKFGMRALAAELARLDAADAEEEPAPIAEEPPAAEPAPAGEGERFNDASVYGAFPDGVLDRAMAIGAAKSEQSDKWPNVEMTLGQFIAKLSTHAVGAKNGESFVTGETIDKRRTKGAMRAMHLMGIDVDCGVPVGEVVSRLRQLGFLAVVYTTHSHLKAATEISQTKFHNWAKKRSGDTEATTERLREFLVEVRGYTPAIAGTVQLLETKHDSDGIKIVVGHDPMHKFRVIVPLAAPFVFADQPVSHMEAMKLWGRKIRGLAKLIGVPLDESCLDPSRLFYLPRHAKGAAHETHIVAGALLDIATIAEAGKGEGADAGDPFASAASALGAREVTRSEDGRHTKNGIDLWRWNKTYGQGFEIAQVFRDYVPDKIRDDHGDKLTIECPFDGEHSNPGDEEDKGCFVSNASDNPQQTGFVFKCSHNSCSDRGKTDFLCEALNQGWFSDEELTNPDNISIEVEIELEESDANAADDPGADNPAAEGNIQDARKRIKTFTSATPAEDIEDVLMVLARNRASKTQCSKVLQDIKKQTKLPIGDLRGGLKECQAKARQERLKAEAENGEFGPRDSKGRLRLSLTDHGFDGCLDAAKARLIKDNVGTEDSRPQKPRLFNYGNGLTKLNRNPATGEVSTMRCDVDQLRGEMHRSMRFLESTENGERVVEPHQGVARLILVDDDAQKFPVLKAINTSPFFATDGTLVVQEGYHWRSGYYFAPLDGMEIPLPPRHPTAQEALAAAEWIQEELYHDFPFHDEQTGGKASRAHVMALLLQFFMRAMIPGPTPIYFFTKPQPGTGAGLTIESTIIAATGRAAQAQTEIKTEDEIRKSIITKLLSGASYYWLDNIAKTVDSSAFASATTSGMVTDRKLGTNEDITVPVYMAWIFAGNNAAVSDELTRRCVPIRLDAKQDPLKRSKRVQFKHPRLLEWVKDNRGEIVKRCLTIIQYWINAGKPQWSKAATDTLDSFEAWSAIMGGVLECIDMGDVFLANLDEVRRSSTERSEWDTFIQIWWERWGSKPRPIGDPDGHGDWNGNDSLLTAIEENQVDLGLRGGVDNSVKTRSFAAMLVKRKDFVFEIEQGRYALRTGLSSPDPKDRRKFFKLELAPDDPAEKKK